VANEAERGEYLVNYYAPKDWAPGGGPSKVRFRTLAGALSEAVRMRDAGGRSFRVLRGDVVLLDEPALAAAMKRIDALGHERELYDRAYEIARELEPQG
jgi:hypothetical protein